jgi:hypothetical protein
MLILDWLLWGVSGVISKEKLALPFHSNNKRKEKNIFFVRQSKAKTEYETRR